MDFTHFADIPELHEIEKKALVGHQLAILEVVDLLRKFRRAADEILARRYRDGCVSDVDAMNFDSSLREWIDEAVDRFA